MSDTEAHSRGGYEGRNDVHDCVCGMPRTYIAGRLHYVGDYGSLVWASYYYKCPGCSSFSAANLHFEPDSYQLTPIDHYNIPDVKRFLNRRRVDFIRERAVLKDGPTIFDLGSGEGAFTEALRLGYPGATIYAVEADERMPRKFEAEYAGATVVAKYIEDFLADQGEESADLIVLTDVLEHVVAPHHLLSRVARCLKKDGVAYINTPNSLSFASPVLAAEIDWDRANFTCQHLWVMEKGAMANMMAMHFNVIAEDQAFEAEIRGDSAYSTFLVSRRA